MSVEARKRLEFSASRLLVNMLLEGPDEFGAIFGQISGFITDTEMEKS